MLGAYFVGFKKNNFDVPYYVIYNAFDCIIVVIISCVVMYKSASHTDNLIQFNNFVIFHSC